MSKFISHSNGVQTVLLPGEVDVRNLAEVYRASLSNGAKQQKCSGESDQVSWWKVGGVVAFASVMLSAASVIPAVFR